MKGDVINKEEEARFKPYLITGGNKIDDNECLIDVEKFSTKQYLKVLLNPATVSQNFFKENSL